MSINRLFQILLARRNFILICLVSCIVGVVVVTAIIPPIWQASARVILNTLKPDPVTGEMVAPNGGAATSYESTQLSLITDYAVLGKVVDSLGWLSDPNLIEQYQHRSSKDRRDFRSWAAGILKDNTTAKPVRDSTMLEITYSSSNPVQAKIIADAIEKAYVETTLAFRTQEAAHNADWYEGELKKLKTKLDDALTAEAAYERANGVVMANDKMDVDSARLQSMASAGAPLVMPPAMVESTKTSEMDLAQVNAQIAAASRTLGPNNPQMQEMTRRRSGLEALVAKDEAAARAAMAAAAAGSGNTDRQIAAEKSRVIAQSDKVGHLQTLQQDVDQRRTDYQTAAEKFAVYRAQADQDTPQTLTPLPAEIPKSPLFPNWPLAIGGSVVLGLLIGCLGALLMELLNRRVRAPEDLDDDLQIPVIGIIGAPDHRAAARPSLGARLRRPGARLGIARA
jgi:uncharacterized protein involved in exopolysaccharide biosynthesis